MKNSQVYCIDVWFNMFRIKTYAKPLICDVKFGNILFLGVNKEEYKVVENDDIFFEDI